MDQAMIMQHLEQWRSASLDILYMLLQNPSSDTQFNIYAIVAFLACRWAFIRVVHVMNLNELGIFMYFVVIAAAIASVILPLAALKIYEPALYDSPDGFLYIIGIIIGASIVITVPVILSFTRDNYFKTLLAWSVSMIAMVGVMMIATALSDAFFEGKQAYEKGEKRNEETRQLLK